MRKLALFLAFALLLALPGCGSETGLLAGVTASQRGDASGAAELAADFTMELFNAAYEGGDALISPVSVLAALAMAEAGAEGETLSQMEEVFGVDAETMRLALSAYMSSVAGTEAKTANAIWFRDDGSFAPNEDFLADCASFAGAEIFADEFTGALAGKINGWIEEHTDGMIADVLDKIDPDAVMYLVNALAFEADWAEQYREYQVRPGVFYAASGEMETEMMYSDESVYLSGKGFTGFMKPYKGGRYAFAALLPDEDSSLEAMLGSLTGETLAAALEGAENAAVETEMPSFSSEHDAELSETLINMGMADAFNGEKADFSGMGRSALGNIYINRVLHKTFIDVTPLGTRAGAATVVEMNAEGDLLVENVKQVFLDRPFAYMIVDTQYNIPLFFGVVTGEGAAF